jgi:hypothetical protein
MKTIKKYISKIQFISPVFVFLFLILATGKAQSIRNRIEEDEDCSKIIFIYTNIDTLGIKQFDSKIYGMIINTDSINNYGLAFFLRAPRFLFINKSYRLKLFFEDGIYLEYGDINDPDYYDAGTEIEFRAIVYEDELKKMQSSKLCFLRLERPGSYFDITIEPNYQNKLCNLAKFMLKTDPLKN